MNYFTALAGIGLIGGVIVAGVGAFIPDGHVFLSGVGLFVIGSVCEIVRLCITKYPHLGAKHD